MISNELRPWVDYVERNAPDIRARFRPADLDALTDENPWPAIQREFLSLVGGNQPGELGPLLGKYEFGLDTLARRHALAVRELGPEDQAEWSYLMSTVAPLNPSDLYLAPEASDAPIDARGRLRVVWADPADALGQHSHAHNSSLLEFLLLDAHCFLRREACENAAVFGVHPSEVAGQLRGRRRRDIFVDIATHLELEPVVGADDWWLGYETDDAAMWCYVGPEALACEVALMADDARRYREWIHILKDNLELVRLR